MSSPTNSSAVPPNTRAEAASDPSRSWMVGAPVSDARPDESPAPRATPPPTTSQPSGSAPKSVPLKEVVQTIKPADFLAVHTTPCARNGFLTGIGGGAAVGMLRWVMGMPVPRAANWAVGAGAFAAIVQYEWCQSLRRGEQAKMKRIVEVYKGQQNAEKRAAEKRSAEQAEALAKQVMEEQVEARRKSQRSWYKFW
ncbi:hypothetical protein B0H63DRAFT_472709 [Podospora didyma]|uniref:Cytochrome c oxidase assembly protein COX20, mitochondrial n=1 Tax=Podospora didyma TaxID=330526 RepID=A0AAE0TZI8_9PEZI|nr:hypothetical protein B0H63DRAFT_472709 [Podospora didyma]